VKEPQTHMAHGAGPTGQLGFNEANDNLTIFRILPSQSNISYLFRRLIHWEMAPPFTFNFSWKIHWKEKKRLLLLYVPKGFQEVSHLPKPQPDIKRTKKTFVKMEAFYIINMKFEIRKREQTAKAFNLGST
jgi:hypothetical protein